MSNFDLIYSETHEYNDGIVEVLNTTGNLAFAFIAITSSVSSALSAPVLRGFLYQVDADQKRSRP